MNPFSYYSNVTEWPQGYSEQRWNDGSWQTVSGVVTHGTVNLNPRIITPGIISSIEEEALLKSMGKVDEQHLNLGVTFGELGETRRMLMDNARTLATALSLLGEKNYADCARVLFRGDVFTSDETGTFKGRNAPIIFRNKRGKEVTRIKSTSMSLADQWLQLKYGYMTLYKDIYDSFEHLARVLSERPVQVRKSASSTYRKTIRDPESYEGVTIIREEIAQYTCKYVYVFEQAPSAVLLPLKEVGITNPLSILWQLKPLSFVLDWMLPMGRYLDLLDYDLGLNLVRGCKTTFEKTLVRYRVNGSAKVDGGPGGGCTTYARWNSRKTVVACNRAPLSSFPSVPPPRISLNLGPERGLSAVALLKQRLRPFRGQSV